MTAVHGTRKPTCWVCDYNYGNGWLGDVHRNSPIDPDTDRCAEHEYADPLPICDKCGDEVRDFKDPDRPRPPWHCDKPECQPMEGEHPDLHRSHDTAFDRAWALMKAPWIDGGSHHALSGKPVTIQGPLYSGGDTWDEPRYWTDDVSEALAYAMFGSAVAREGLDDSFKEQVKMRETIPSIRVAPDPGDAWRGEGGHIDESLLGEDDDLQNYILHDDQPHSYAWRHDEQWGAPEHHQMPTDELEAMIQQIVDSGDDHFRWGNTGTSMTQEARRAHILGALERLQTNTRGETYLPDEVKQFVETSETDELTGDDEEEHLREWGRWEQ